MSEDVINLYRELLLQNDVANIQLDFLEAQKDFLSVQIDKKKQVEIELRIKSCNKYLNQIQEKLEKLYLILKNEIIARLNYTETIVFREYILKGKEAKDICREYRIAESTIRNASVKIRNQIEKRV